jgi:hypothetical protein
MKGLLHHLIILCALVSSLSAQNVGDQAPDFMHNTLNHGEISLSDYNGKIVYLFFFAWW